MPNRKIHTLKVPLLLRLPVSGKGKVLFMVMVLAIAVCVAGGAGARATAAEDAPPCEWQPSPMRCYTPGDYDGDHKADLAVFRPGEGIWYVQQSSDGRLNAAWWGLMNDKLVSADYDGDQKEDFAIYRKVEGTWWILYSSTGDWSYKRFGGNDAEPAPADYDGDGKADLAVSIGGQYRFIKSTNEETVETQVVDRLLSNHNDINVPGDYDGDGRADPAILHDPNPPPSDPPGEGEVDLLPRSWRITFSSTHETGVFDFGEEDDVPVPGDYNGDGKTDIAVWRPGTGTWHIVENLTPRVALVARCVRWGLAEDKVAPGDYDGDGKTDVAVWRPSEGVWYIIYSWTGERVYPRWGMAGDIPVLMSLKRHEHPPQTELTELSRR